MPCHHPSIMAFFLKSRLELSCLIGTANLPGLPCFSRLPNFFIQHVSCWHSGLGTHGYECVFVIIITVLLLLRMNRTSVDDTWPCTKTTDTHKCEAKNIWLGVTAVSLLLNILKMKQYCTFYLERERVHWL